jgi:hypothetical protein
MAGAGAGRFTSAAMDVAGDVPGCASLATWSGFFSGAMSLLSVLGEDESREAKSSGADGCTSAWGAGGFA